MTHTHLSLKFLKTHDRNALSTATQEVSFLGCAKVFLCLMLNQVSNYHYYYYLRQVNEVNGGDNAFVRSSMCVCLCLCVRSGRSWELNVNSTKTVKATDFTFDTSLPRNSPDTTPKNFSKRGRGQDNVTP